VFQFNMGKKFGGYSWLRSADSRRRRLEYFLGNKWERDGDSVGQEELKAGEEVATCPSCSLIVKVIYDLVSSCHQWILL
ncbi:hypothetical protein B7P43_G03761, partial [Cryptotermes secundus]